MSVIIKNMKMPKSCKSCDLLQDYDGDMYCPLNDYLNFGDIENVPDYVMDGCRLGALPEKHGRLIDGDELFKHMNIAIAMMSGMMKAIGAEDDEGMQMELKAYRDIRDGIKDYETVIEAEGEE